MVNLPISDYVKNYYQEHNIVLDDFTQAVIIDSQRQEWLDWSKRIAMLQEIAESTADEGLKLQIEDHIAYQMQEKAWFMENQNGKYIYSVSYCGWYDTFDKAFEAGKQSGKSEIYITKYDEYLCRTIHPEAGDVGVALWDEGGNTLLRLRACMDNKDYPKNTHGKKKRFDDYRVVPCVFPFERGDIVRDIRTGEVGVLQTSKLDWDNRVKKTETDECPYFEDGLYANEVSVRSVESYNGPHLFDSGNYLLHLEKITEAQSGIDADILRCIFRIMEEDIAVTNHHYHVCAERKIGLWFYHGDGVSQNDELAFRWLRYAAGNGDTEARYWIGKLYAEGCGIEQDFAKALNWYLAAARNDHVEAQFEVGRYYADGIGVPPKRKKAVEWFQKAADQGHVKACLRLKEFMDRT